MGLGASREGKAKGEAERAACSSGSLESGTVLQASDLGSTYGRDENSQDVLRLPLGCQTLLGRWSIRSCNTGDSINNPAKTVGCCAL